MSQSRELWKVYPRRAETGSQTDISPLLQAGCYWKLVTRFDDTFTLFSSAGNFLQPRALLLGRSEFSAQLGNNQCLLDRWLVHRGQLQL